MDETLSIHTTVYAVIQTCSWADRHYRIHYGLNDEYVVRVVFRSFVVRKIVNKNVRSKDEGRIKKFFTQPTVSHVSGRGKTTCVIYILIICCIPMKHSCSIMHEFKRIFWPNDTRTYWYDLNEECVHCLVNCLSIVWKIVNRNVLCEVVVGIKA